MLKPIRWMRLMLGNIQPIMTGCRTYRIPALDRLHGCCDGPENGNDCLVARHRIDVDRAYGCGLDVSISKTGRGLTKHAAVKDRGAAMDVTTGLHALGRFAEAYHSSLLFVLAFLCLAEIWLHVAEYRAAEAQSANADPDPYEGPEYVSSLARFWFWWLGILFVLVFIVAWFQPVAGLLAVIAALAQIGWEVVNRLRAG
jgi:hypothetical protein